MLHLFLFLNFHHFPQPRIHFLRFLMFQHSFAEKVDHSHFKSIQFLYQLNAALNSLHGSDLSSGFFFTDISSIDSSINIYCFLSIFLLLFLFTTVFPFYILLSSELTSISIPNSSSNMTLFTLSFLPIVLIDCHS